MQEKEGRMTMSELRAQVINLLQDAWELGYECGAKDVSSARTVTLDAMTDTELAEHGLVRLPVDADGEPIRVGDVMGVTDGLREAFDSCTVMAGVENDFECVYIVKAAAMLYLDEIDAAFRELAQTTAKCQNGECDRYEN